MTIDKIYLEDGMLFRIPGNEELVRIQQSDGLGDDVKLDYLDRDRDDHPDPIQPADDVAEQADAENWEPVTGGILAGHVWGKVVETSTNCPECGQFVSAIDNVTLDDHRGRSSGGTGAFFPELWCPKVRCDGHLSYEELKDRGVWLDIEDIPREGGE